MSNGIAGQSSFASNGSQGRGLKPPGYPTKRRKGASTAPSHSRLD